VSVSKTKQLLTTLEEWEKHAGPKRPSQWKEGRSGMEAARMWLSVSSPQLPAEVASALAGHPDFGPVLSWSAEPEVRLSFDGFGGEPRNTDLLVSARDLRGEFLIAVEAKADESFGETVTKATLAAKKRRLKNPRSKGLVRIEGLLELLFGTSIETEPSLGNIRYQLLTATAGALAASRKRGNQRVILLVQEFRTSETNDRRHSRNGDELDAFASRLTNSQVPNVKAGQLYGPISFKNAAKSGALYLGKVTQDLRPGTLPVRQ
jgi:hypothetical protein